jgi:hypothetical protein
MSKSDFDTILWLSCLLATAIGIGFWQHSIGLGVAVFFGTMTYLFHRAR